MCKDKNGNRLEMDFEIENKTCEKLLEVHFHNRLNFDYHISGLCKKASKEIMH